MSVQNIDSAPSYIMKFIHGNMEQLCNIYDEGMYNNPDLDRGILVFQCSENNNTMDVQFMNDEMMEQIIDKENIINIKNNSQPDKKIFFVQDLDLGCIFLLQI
jgi:hypothetical protein